MPFDEIDTRLVPEFATVQNRPRAGDQQIDCHADASIVRAVHDVPFDDVAMRVEPPPEHIANRLSDGDQATAVGANEFGVVRIVHVTPSGEVIASCVDEPEKLIATTNRSRPGDQQIPCGV